MCVSDEYVRREWTVGELIELLEKYPEDIKIVLGVEPEGELGLYNHIQVGGLDLGSEKVFYVASKDLSDDISIWKSSVEL